jgi:hypothetical protein
MHTEMEHFAEYIGAYTKAKAFVTVQMLGAYPALSTATSRSEVIATLAATDVTFIPCLTKHLIAGDLEAARDAVKFSLSALEQRDPLLFAPQPSKYDLEQLFYEAQRTRVFSPQGAEIDNAEIDNRAHVKASVDRMDIDTARRFAYETRHKIDAAKKAKVTTS